jgi:hypothetical protein
LDAGFNALRALLRRGEASPIPAAGNREADDVAILHNKAGQWGKDVAWRKFQLWLSAALVVMTALGFAGGAFLTRGMGYAGFAVFMTILAGFWLLLGPFNRMVDALAKERIRYLRGAQAEALVAWAFQSLADDWHVFNNVQLEEASDVDHVLVGPGGVWCVSTKSHRGLLTAGPDGQLQWRLAATTSRTRAAVSFGPADAGKRAWALARALNAKGEPGPVGEPVSVLVAVAAAA